MKRETPLSASLLASPFGSRVRAVVEAFLCERAGQSLGSYDIRRLRFVFAAVLATMALEQLAQRSSVPLSGRMSPAVLTILPDY
jgi:hypothetical protein